MTYNELPSKLKRIAERDLQTLYSPTALEGRPSLDVIQKRFFFGTLRYKGGQLFLSDRGITAIRRLIEIVCRQFEPTKLVSASEVGNQVYDRYNSWLEK